ncbi:MAG TPA: tetratricopeptide repeat protein [bacterium]|nr:tetratricopeptide repeat protein [bacterium]
MKKLLKPLSSLSRIKFRFYKPSLTPKIHKSKILSSIIMLIIFGAGVYFLYPELFAPKIKKIETPFKGANVTMPAGVSDNMTGIGSAYTGDSQQITALERGMLDSASSETNTFAANLLDAGLPLPVVIKEGEDVSNQIKFFQAAMESYFSGKWALAIEYFAKTVEFAGLKSDYTKQSYLKLAEIYFNTGNYKKSVEYYNFFISTFGESYEKIAAVYYNMGAAFYKSKEFEKGRYYFEKARAKNNLLAEPYIGLGNYYLDKRQIDDALKIYSEALSVNPKNPDLNYNLGYIYFYFKDNIKSNPASKTYFDAVINYSNPAQPAHRDLISRAASYNYLIAKKNGYYPAAYNYLIKTAESLFRYKELGEIYFLLNKDMDEIERTYAEYVFKEEPYNSQNYVSLGDKFYERGNYEKSLYYYYRGLKADNKSVSAYYGVGRSSVKLNCIDLAYSAFASLEKSITVREIPLIDWTGIPDDKAVLNAVLKDAYNYLGYLCSVKNEFKNAVVCYENSMKLTDKSAAPALAELNYNIGVIYEQYLKDAPSAEKYYLEALKKMPYTKKYEKALGTFYFALGDYNKAKDFLKRGVNSMEETYLLAYSLYKENEFDKAENLFKRILEQSRDSIILNAANKTLGSIYFFRYKSDADKNDLNKALTYFNQAIRFNEKDDASFYNCGLTNYLAADYNRAINYFKSAIELNPSNSKYYSGLANCYYEKNLFDLAEKNYRKAVEIDGSNLEAHYNLTRIKEKRYE